MDLMKGDRRRVFVERLVIAFLLHTFKVHSKGGIYRLTLFMHPPTYAHALPIFNSYLDYSSLLGICCRLIY